MKNRKPAKNTPAKAGAIHDFKCADLYPNHEGLQAWRWEFLRRNSEYQASFASHGKTHPPHPDCWNFGLRTWPDPAFEWPVAMVAFRTAVGLTELPTLDALERWMRRGDFDALQILRSLLTTFTEWRRNGMRVALVDVSLPIREQLNTLEELLADRSISLDERVSPKLERVHSENWAGYLRILDGYAAGFKPIEIAAVMYPGQPDGYANGNSTTSKVRMAYKRAIDLTKTFAIPRAHLKSRESR